ncbi:hypothetical protein [Amycolatopsis alkalitolerans]|uniref:Uncharacterized protein n=1 Tax=Amycolatopsis alkalitolerans TaxID=2547244 RepID=A0A5C4LT46_9PSEU|nr:hypothetical protein [Amycolatopsis alkalitolerans]TNC20080.1 hypothetical protein FG385_31645 [Amycolatopsis alkalitolerans]
MPKHDADNGNNDAAVIPLRATRSSTRDTWRVVRIDTEPMTAQHYDQAVTALAALIEHWKDRRDTNDGTEKAA